MNEMHNIKSIDNESEEAFRKFREKSKSVNESLIYTLLLYTAISFILFTAIIVGKTASGVTLKNVFISEFIKIPPSILSIPFALLATTCTIIVAVVIKDNNDQNDTYKKEEKWIGQYSIKNALITVLKLLQAIALLSFFLFIISSICLIYMWGSTDDKNFPPVFIGIIGASVSFLSIYLVEYTKQIISEDSFIAEGERSYTFSLVKNNLLTIFSLSTPLPISSQTLLNRDIFNSFTEPRGKILFSYEYKENNFFLKSFSINKKSYSENSNKFRYLYGKIVYRLVFTFIIISALFYPILKLIDCITKGKGEEIDIFGNMALISIFLTIECVTYIYLAIDSMSKSLSVARRYASGKLVTLTPLTDFLFFTIMMLPPKIIVIIMIIAEDNSNIWIKTIISFLLIMFTILGSVKIWYFYETILLKVKSTTTLLAIENNSTPSKSMNRKEKNAIRIHTKNKCFFNELMFNYISSYEELQATSKQI